MSKSPGHVTVTTEVGYCNFCGRPRNLRREERHLGDLVRTNVTCESCHRTLFSTMGVATAVQPEPAQAPEGPAAKPEPDVTKPEAAIASPSSRPEAAKAKTAAPKPKSNETKSNETKSPKPKSRNRPATGR